MIEFDKFQLENGLRVIVHRDTSTPIAAVNVLYDVGAKDEDSDCTGFAHLFEHLMFGGSVNIADFETPLQQAGGENNAFTSNDITNYYLTIPVSNIETGFWLESDRMLSLAFTPESLEIQRQVVIEEFKQRYLNQPYGDVWLLLRPEVYKKHPYRWATIGKEISHIEDATMDQVKAFFKKHYTPQNAILSVAGDVTLEQVKTLAEKWFGAIPMGEKYVRDLPEEPEQTRERKLTVKRKVPYDSIYKAFRMGSRRTKDYYMGDLTSDLLSRGKSARLYNRLVKEKQLFSELAAFITGDMETGLLLVQGKLAEGVELEVAERELEEELWDLAEQKVSDRELEKVRNKVESTKVFSEMSVLNKAMNLAYYELLGDAEMINQEVEKYQEITPEDMLEFCAKTLRKSNMTTLYYLAEV